jgi:hypothetical protein
MNDLATTRHQSRPLATTRHLSVSCSKLCAVRRTSGLTAVATAGHISNPIPSGRFQYYFLVYDCLQAVSFLQMSHTNLYTCHTLRPPHPPRCESRYSLSGNKQAAPQSANFLSFRLLLPLLAGYLCMHMQVRDEQSAPSELGGLLTKWLVWITAWLIVLSTYYNGACCLVHKS